MSHTAAVRAAVTAELLAGDSQRRVAERHGVPRSTVANWGAALPEDMRDALRANHGWQDLAAQVLETGLLALGRALARLDEAPAA
ncbi:MAG: helix-turn-helix domain-containing protein, partial [Chloroflexi bacterium]|nr:helix-turn-helix domain-containing protein [Chloroflexota bacterium]